MKKFQIDESLKQINFLDERFYTFDNETFYPSVTTILDVYPKGFGFNQWLKTVGEKASEIADKAAAIGSKIHNATEMLNNGHELEWNELLYSLEEWQMILKYAEFWKTCNPILEANEISLGSKELGFAGTLDRVVQIEGVRWLLDIKTSNYLHKSHELQLAAYAKLWNERFPGSPIDKTGIIWLKASTRTDKIDHSKSIYQGKGWQIATFDRHHTETYKIFEHTHNIWKEENPNPKPANMIYPLTVKL